MDVLVITLNNVNQKICISKAPDELSSIQLLG
jgi:hypothetical protein